MIKKFQLTAFIREYEIIIASVILICMLLIGCNLFLIPNFNRVREIYFQKGQLQQQYDKLKQKNNILADLDSKYYENNLPKLYKVLPDGKDYISLFETLDNIEKKNNVKITKADFPLGVLGGNVKQLKKSKTDASMLLPMTMDIQGEMSSLINCLGSLSDLTGRVIQVDSLALQGLPSGLYTLSITGNAYIVPASGTIGDVGTPLPKISSTALDLFDKIAQIKMDMQIESTEKISQGKKNLFD